MTHHTTHQEAAHQEATHQEAIKKLHDLIDDIDVAMMTTAEADGTLHSRPMYTQRTESDDHLWFFSERDAPKVSQIQHNQQVNISYAEPEDQKYVSVSGTAQIVDDRQKIDEMWNPAAKAWFPDGKDDPNLTLIKVTPTRAEYWDAPSGALVQIAGFAKALATGERPDDVGENEKLTL